MKKSWMVFLAVFIALLSVYQPQIVHGEENGLLQGKQAKIWLTTDFKEQQEDLEKIKHSGLTEAATDGDSKTFVTLTNIYGGKNTLVFNFSTPVNITAIKINYKMSGSNYNAVTYEFFDPNNKYVGAEGGLYLCQ
ncbi:MULTISPECIES: hypothetical protein [Paenibacillus]|uniref:hypothetical protein n=2 Tax=Paenibacillus TaxID=44249 RepID=UPI000ECADBBA|nr:hypothetical protein [Paenibacillus macerans]GBK65116.1 hypothetical protein PbDSM24746_51200 [Paenibacillus macerans]GBK71409.1 hypothetical protein PbJCM17693_51170 [Paenibacillus macerans]